MPRILRIINRLNLGGPTYNAVYLTCYLQPEFETLLAGGVKTEEEESSEFIVRNAGIEPYIIPEMSREVNPVNDLIALYKLQCLIRDFRPDIVHTHAAKAGALGRMAALLRNVPLRVHTYHGHYFHSYFNPLKTRFFLGIERWLGKTTQAIIALSQTQKHELANIHRICQPEKIHVIPLGFELDRFTIGMEEKRRLFREQYGLTEDQVAIGIIGRLVPVKNHSMFLHAFKRVLDASRTPVKAFIIGDGGLRSRLEKEAVSLGLSIATTEHRKDTADVVFTSWIKEIDTAIAGLDIVALTSYNEGTPVSLIEAQAAGKPVVSTRVGGVEDIIIENVTGWLCPINESQVFADALRKLSEDFMLRRSVATPAREHVMSRYHVSRMAEEMRQLYRMLLNQ